MDEFDLVRKLNLELQSQQRFALECLDFSPILAWTFCTRITEQKGKGYKKRHSKRFPMVFLIMNFNFETAFFYVQVIIYVTNYKGTHPFFMFR